MRHCPSLAVRHHVLPMLFALGLGVAQAQNGPKIAVTDLAYTVAVQQYFEAGISKSNSTLNVDRRTVTATEQTQGKYIAGTQSFIEQRELGSFTNDIKGAILKGSTFRLVQPKAFDAGQPQPSKAEQVLNQLETGKIAKPVRQPEVRDIVDRIRKGEFKGADYVLFGTLTSIQFRDSVSAIQGTGSTELDRRVDNQGMARESVTRNAGYASHIFSLDLVADFSLISTQTMEIKAAFSAQGAGSETKLLTTRGDLLPPNRGKVMRETSRSLAGDVFTQLAEQLTLAEGTISQQLRPETDPSPAPARRSAPRAGQAPQEEVMILK